MKDKRKVGRPTKYTQEIGEKLCEIIAAGNYRQTAYQFVGVPKRTFEAWVERIPEFQHMILQAEQRAEIRCVTLIMKAAAEDPKHAEWWLERKCYPRWGRKDKQTLEHTGAAGGPIQIVQLPTKLSVDEWEESFRDE